jgi:hypothetical protein
MRFGLPHERPPELQEKLAELEKWIQELEQLDLEEYDLVLDPSSRRPDGD